jgi:hypothetical protein
MSRYLFRPGLSGRLASPNADRLRPGAGIDLGRQWPSPPGTQIQAVPGTQVQAEQATPVPCRPCSTQSSLPLALRVPSALWPARSALLCGDGTSLGEGGSRRIHFDGASSSVISEGRIIRMLLCNGAAQPEAPTGRRSWPARSWAGATRWRADRPAASRRLSPDPGSGSPGPGQPMTTERAGLSAGPHPTSFVLTRHRSTSNTGH